MKRSDLLKTSLKVLISVGIIGVLLVKIKPEDLLHVIQEISIWQLGLALLFYFGCQLISAFRWHIVAHCMGLGGGLLLFYQYYLMGMFFNLFMPTAVGGDVGRAMLLAKEKSATWLRAFLSILAERFCGLNGLLIFVISGLLVVKPERWEIYLPTFGLLLIGTLIFTLGFRWIEHHEWGHRFIHRFVLKNQEETEDPGSIWPKHRAVLMGIGVSLLFHATSVLVKLFLMKQLGIDIPILLIAIVYGLAGLASMLPSIGGIGPREGAITYLLVELGHVPQNKALAYSLVWLSLLLLATIPGALLSLKHQLMVPAHKKV